MATTYAGIYRGLTVDVTDPMGHGRVMVRVPVIDASLTQWAPVCRPFGLSFGASAPTVGREVWIMFEAGDPTRPIVMGQI